MKFLLVLTLLLMFWLNAAAAQTPEDLASAWEKNHISSMMPSNARHKDLQKYLEQLRKLGLKVEEVGRSYADREIYQIEWGKGAKKVFLWSQMHGDEPTATSALVDMFAFLQKNRDKEWVKKLENALTIRAVPMLNPDGAELYQRRSLQSIDINRDAAALVTPEAKLLKKLRDEWSPEIGFNLHNQQALTTVGDTAKQAAISFLTVTGEVRDTEGNARNKRLSSLMIAALQRFIPGHIGRYGDDYNPAAFGDKFSDWGTPVILIETGALDGKDEMFLVKLNFVAYLTAFNALAGGEEKTAAPTLYENTPFNGSGKLYSAIFRNAEIVDLSCAKQNITADIAVNIERRRAAYLAPAFVRQIGDLTNLTGLEEYEVSDYYVVARYGVLGVGAPGELLFYKKTRRIDWTASELEKKFPPDAVYSIGRFTKPLVK